VLLHLANTVRQGAAPDSVVPWQVKSGDRMTAAQSLTSTQWDASPHTHVA